MTASSISPRVFERLSYVCTHTHTQAVNAQRPVVPADLNVNECLWSRKMSFAQWHRKHTVPSDRWSQSWFVSVCLSISVIDTQDTHTHTHTGSALDTLGPLHCQYGKESSFCSALISLWVLNWQLRGTEYLYY